MFTWENSHWREFHTDMTFWFCIAFTWWMGPFTSCYLKVHLMLKKCMCDSELQTLRMRYPFQSTGKWKWVFVSRLHDTIARFHTRVKFSPQYKSRGELTLGWLTPCLVPRPYYSTRPKRFGSCGLIENVHWPFASDTSPKWIDREGLWKRRTGTRQTHASMKFLMVSCKQI